MATIIQRGDNPDHVVVSTDTGFVFAAYREGLGKPWVAYVIRNGARITMPLYGPAANNIYRMVNIIERRFRTILDEEIEDEE